MDRAVGVRSHPQPLARSVCRAAATWLVLFSATARAADGPAPATALPWIAISLVSALAGAWVVWWLLRRQHETATELRHSRTQLQCLLDLSNQWHWQTDSLHRVIEWRPPVNSIIDGPPPPAAELPLWSVWVVEDAALLQARMERHEPLHYIVVQRPAPKLTNSLASGRLRARARVDERGRFAGYQGALSLDPAPATEPVPAQGAATTAGTFDSDHESFGYTISHDLRAPIRVVEGFTRILKEDYGRVLDRVGNDHLDRVLGAAARMNGMIDALLALSRLSSQPLARQPVNLSQLAGYVAEDLRRQSPGREVVLHIEPGLQVMGDPTLLRMVLENLLGNAWKYTGKSPAPEIWLERTRDATDAFTVRDNGAGFDMRFADRLFGVFQRLHSASDFQGTGIGLASVRRIVRRHGGEVWAEGEVGRGASFHFSLPQTAAATSSGR
jgi:signal transduction histidine kinase